MSLGKVRVAMVRGDIWELGFRTMCCTYFKSQCSRLKTRGREEKNKNRSTKTSIPKPAWGRETAMFLGHKHSATHKYLQSIE